MSSQPSTYSFAGSPRRSAVWQSVLWCAAAASLMLATVQGWALLDARRQLEDAQAQVAARAAVQASTARPVAPGPGVIADAGAYERQVAARAAQWAQGLRAFEAARPDEARVVRLALDGSRRSLAARFEVDRQAVAVQWLGALVQDGVLTTAGAGSLKGCERVGERNALQQCEIEVSLP